MNRSKLPSSMQKRIWIGFLFLWRFLMLACCWIVDVLLTLLRSPDLNGPAAEATPALRMANRCSGVKEGSGASSVFGGDGRSQTTTNVEMTGDFEPTGFACRHHVVEDLIGDGFMKCAFIPV